MYLPSLTDEELLRYAVPETELEKELLKRWKTVLNEFNQNEVDELLQEIHSLNVEMRQLKEELAEGCNNVV